LVVLAHDPQTSGGLLAAVPQDRTDAMLAELAAAGVEAWSVGSVEAGAGIALS
jgi:selenide,water dikinase